jgi:hypothetical protein
MPKSRDSSLISAADVPELVNQLNFILQRFADRLDKIEGIRDSFESADATFDGPVEATSLLVKDGTETLHSLGE